MPTRAAALALTLLCSTPASGIASPETPSPALLDSAWAHLVRYAGRSSMKYLTFEAIDTVQSELMADVGPRAAWRIRFRFRRPGAPPIDQRVEVALDSVGCLAPLIFRIGEVLTNDPIEGIPPCARDSSLCAPSITPEEAIGIARKHGVATGVGPVKVEFGWNRLRRRFMWIVSNTLIDEGPCNRSGRVVWIDSSTGEPLWGGAWTQEC